MSMEIDLKVSKKLYGAFLPSFSRFFTKTIIFREWGVNKIQNDFTFSLSDGIIKTKTGNEIKSITERTE